MEQNSSQEQQQQQQQNNRRVPVAVAAAAAEAAARNHHPPAQACPRCNSTNTKFCYYNNYSLSQPRYFCKGCRRYWTQGGTLRNVPVGGGCRKSKRPKLSPSVAAAAAPTTLSVSPQEATSNPGVAAINSGFYGGAGGGGFLSTLAGVQPLGFDPNVGLLHGLGFSGFENSRPIEEYNNNSNNNNISNDDNNHPEFSFQELLQQRHSMFSDASTSGNWNVSNDNNNNNNDDNENGGNPSQWADFSTGGLDDP